MKIGVVLGSGHGPDGTTGRLVAELLDRIRALPGADLDTDTVIATELGLGPDCPACRAKVDAALDEIAATALAAPAAGEPKPSTADLIGFRVAKILVDGGRDEGPVDAAYWDERGWFDADWWTDQKPPLVANRIARMVEKKIRKGIESGSADPYRG